ncbi:SRPBCC family protein [Massilia sp. GCM10023247]|uniref:SRPBCC family protein n=1 Tax=Massilia sp. GCM10023247 TaxID=3252643 RepID=UPI00361D733F
MRQHTTTTDSSLNLETSDVAMMLGGAAAGALLMYMLDPDRGSARRSTSTAAIRHAGSRTGDALGNAWHGIGERIGMAAREAGNAASDLADDATTGASKFLDEAGNRASRAYESAKPNGSAGRALENSYDSASRMAGEAGARADAAATRFSRMASQAAGRAMGALHLEDRDDVSALLRNPAVVGGGLLGLFGLMRRSPLAAALGLAGLALATRSSGGGISSLFGADRSSAQSGRGRGKRIELEKSIRIDASPEDVYELWSNYENFPRFMSHVIEVRDLGRRRSHWVVQGPAGTQFEFDSVLTEQSKGRRLAWRSEPGAEIENAGSVQFEPYRGGTLVTVRLSYTPPAGALGHGLASLLGSDPKRQMDDDLARMKHFVERGVIPHDAARREKSGSRFLH